MGEEPERLRARKPDKPTFRDKIRRRLDPLAYADFDALCEWEGERDDEHVLKELAEAECERLAGRVAALETVLTEVVDWVDDYPTFERVNVVLADVGGSE